MTVAALILIELAVATLGGVVFIALYAWRSEWTASPMGRHTMAFAIVYTGEAGGLLALGLGVPVPLWAFAVGFGALDLVVVHRLLLLWRAQRRR